MLSSETGGFGGLDQRTDSRALYVYLAVTGIGIFHTPLSASREANLQ